MCNILVNLKGPCSYLLMGFNDYLGPLVNVEGVTSISTISLVDVDVGSFSSYIYQPTPWAKYTKTTLRGAPSLRNPSYSKLYFSSLSLAVAVVVVAAAAAGTTSCFTAVRYTAAEGMNPSTLSSPRRRCSSLAHLWQVNRATIYFPLPPLCIIL